MRYFLLTHFFLVSMTTYAQYKYDQYKLDKGDLVYSCSRKFTPKMEVLIGPGFQLPAVYHQFPDQERKTKFGYVIGFGILRPINSRIEINARILREEKRFGNWIKNDYLTINIAPQLILGKKRQFAIGGGGYFSRLQRSQTTTIFPDPNSTVPAYSTRSTYDWYKKYEVGLIVTLGYTILFSRKHSMVIQLLGSSGLGKINNNPAPNTLPILRNNSIALLAAIRFKGSRNSPP